MFKTLCLAQGQARTAAPGDNVQNSFEHNIFSENDYKQLIT